MQRGLQISVLMENFSVLMVDMDLDGEEEFKNTKMRIEYSRMAF